MPESVNLRFRGGDIEENQLLRLIRDLATANPENRNVQQMLELVADGYQRTEASRLLDLALQGGPLNGGLVGGVPLPTLIIKSLEVEVDRARPETSGLQASLRRERVMKDFLLTHYRAAGQDAKVAAVFGRNHLHRGIDRRGVATLGNFIAELAVVEGKGVFNVAIFAAGGQVAAGGVRDFDERKDDPAFAYLASASQFKSTVFDLKPLREPLHQIASRTPVEESLVYWADSYDVLVCYREVSPTKIR
jgi:hypothetical protein